MATVAVDLFVLWQRDRFITSLANPATPTLPAIVAGDTWNISAYFVDDTTPKQIHRFATDAVSVRIRAQGNNHGYADSVGGGQTEIVPSAPVIVHTQFGSSTVVEKQSVTFPSLPSGGTFRILFGGAGSGTRGGGMSLGNLSPYEIATGPIAYNASAADILAAILAVPGYYRGNDGPYTYADLAARYGSAIRSPVVTGSVAAGFVIEFGDVFSGANWWNTGIHLVTLDESGLQYNYGWSLVLPFTAGDFTDYLIGANGPSFFEVMLNGSQAAFIQLTGDPVGGANVPGFTNGPPPNSGNVGTPYDFVYTASGFPAPTFSVTSGALPSGLSLTSAGRLSGTPSATGTFSGVVTATNSAGTATQAFSIAIGVNPSPGPGGVGRLASYRDDPNQFHVLDYSDGPYLETRDDEWPGLQIWHVPYCIDFDNYLGSVPAIGAYDPAFGYFWKDTPFKHIGDGIVEFERLFHNIPGDTTRKISVTKNYQATDFTFSGGHVLDQAIIGFTRKITAVCSYHYALDDPGALPVIPFIQMIPYLRSQAMWDLGTGFPTGTLGGVAGLYTNNFAASPLPDSDFEHILGRLFCRKIITG